MLKALQKKPPRSFSKNESSSFLC